MTHPYGDADRPGGRPMATSDPATATYDSPQYEGYDSRSYETPRRDYRSQREEALFVPMSSRIRGSAVWSGFAIGFGTWILLELAFFALDLGALAANVVPDADTSSWWWSGLAAAIGFFVGGLVAGASTSSTDIDDGLLHGIAVWSLTVVSLLLLSAAGLGIGFGAFGDLLATSSSLAEADTSVVNDAQAAAGAALLALTIALVAAAIGGAVGAKMWPRRDDTIDLRDRHRVR